MKPPVRDALALKTVLLKAVAARPGRTARALATAVRMSHLPSRVIDALNDLRTDGLVIADGSPLRYAPAGQDQSGKPPAVPNPDAPPAPPPKEPDHLRIRRQAARPGKVENYTIDELRALAATGKASGNRGGRTYRLPTGAIRRVLEHVMSDGVPRSRAALVAAMPEFRPASISSALYAMAGEELVVRLGGIPTTYQWRGQPGANRNNPPRN